MCSLGTGSHRRTQGCLEAWQAHEMGSRGDPCCEGRSATRSDLPLTFRGDAGTPLRTHAVSPKEPTGLRRKRRQGADGGQGAGRGVGAGRGQGAHTGGRDGGRGRTAPRAPSNLRLWTVTF